jgi:ArsR family transcriptional regulator, arsenate/arsenite/antimonite-responsive transcriptional repressor
MNPNVDLIGDPTRRCMLALLAAEGEVCVCEFVAALEEIQPSVSRHLGLLREGGWIVSRREGTWMHYRLARLPKWAQTLVDALVAGGVAPEVLRDARRRLATFAGRPPRSMGRAA